MHGTSNPEVEKGHDNYDDDNDIDIHDEATKASNDNNYQEHQPQNPISTIGHPSRSQITRALQFQIVKGAKNLGI